MTHDEAILLAIAWGDAGIPAFPVAVGPGKDGKTTKRPLTQHGHLDATVDAGLLRRRFNGATIRPTETWAVGLHPGPAGYVVVDPDIGGGIETFAALEKEHGDAGGMRYRTASGGLHVWFTKPDGLHVGNQPLAAGIDVRSDDGWVVAPGVRTPWGTWGSDDGVNLADATSAPGWIVERLNGAHSGADSNTGPAAPRPAGDWSVETKIAAADGVAALAGQNRHDNTTGVVMRLARLDTLEHPGAAAALDALGVAYVASVADSRGGTREAAGEYRRMVDGARNKLAADPPTGPTYAELAAQKDIGSLVTVGATRPSGPVAPDVTWPAPPGYPTPPRKWAYHGLAGAIVEAYHGLHEADPVAVLAQFLGAFGNAVGRGPHIEVAGTRHAANLFVLIAGETSLGRKGTSKDVALTPIRAADGGWAHSCVASGLSSGEGLINLVRDPTINAKGDVTDPGVTDKRLLVIETEFASVLVKGGRVGNALTIALRQAWDGDRLQNVSIATPRVATAAHVSLIGHVTPDELRETMGTIDILNGFSNRMLWVASRSDTLLPHAEGLPGHITVELANRTLKALQAARKIGVVRLDDDARDMWAEHYVRLRNSGYTGALAAATARAPVQALRLALVYALTDASPVITTDHLAAGLELWDYAERSARWLFGTSTGNDEADTLLDALRDGYPQPIALTGARNYLGRHSNPKRALQTLVDQALAEQIRVPSAGRTATAWRAVPVKATP